MTKKLVTTIALFVCIISQSIAQVQITPLPNGTYQYNSVYNNSDLEFFLFGDGYYTFEHDPKHQYKDNGIPSDAVLFYIEPYDDDEPEELALHTVYNGVTNPYIEPTVFTNKVELKTSWNLVQNKKNYYILMFENNKNYTTSGCIEFHFDNAMSFVIQPQILDDYNNDWVEDRTPLSSEYSEYTNKFKWDYNNLQPGEQRFVYIPVGCMEDTGGTVKTMAIMKEGDCSKTIDITGKGDGHNEDVTNADYFTLSSFVSTNPHDPNCILTKTECLEKEDEQTVVYRVYFQNEGSTPATNVYLDYYLNAPYKNVVLRGASDACKLTFLTLTGTAGESEIEIDFLDIFLQGTGQQNAPSYEETIGWVEFAVCYDLDKNNLSSLLDINCINNSVDIIFDDEDPVTAYHELCQESECQNPNVTNSFLDICDAPIMPIQYFRKPGNHPLVGQNEEIEAQTISNTPLDLNNQVIESLLDEELKIYPNPALDYVLVNIPQKFINAEIKIYNTKGQVLMFKKTSEENLRLDISEFNTGLYYLTFTNDKEIKTSTFVKM